MPIIQGGPPEWIWERTADPLKWSVVRSEQPNGQDIYELRLDCGLRIMRLQFFTAEEMARLQSALSDQFAGSSGVNR